MADGSPGLWQVQGDQQACTDQIADLLAILDIDGGMVVGSRHVAGARLDPSLVHARTLLSRVGTLMARPLADCRDPLSGFFAIDRLTAPDLDGFHPLGY